MKTVESIFHVFLVLTAFLAYFNGHLHLAFWFAVAWACYLMVAVVIYARMGETIKKLEKELSRLKHESFSPHHR